MHGYTATEHLDSCRLGQQVSSALPQVAEGALQLVQLCLCNCLALPDADALLTTRM